MKHQYSAAELSRATESIVITLAQQGSAQAFSEIVRRRHRQVRNFMCYLCKHPDQGDDLAQQVFLTAWRTIRRLKSVGAFGAWLKRIMVTTWLEHARRTELAYSSAVDTAQLSAGNPTMSVGLDLEKALAELPSAMRLCVVLAYHEGMTHEEIATLSEMPLGTVKSNIARGSARLREFLAGYGVRDREDCYAK